MASLVDKSPFLSLLRSFLRHTLPALICPDRYLLNTNKPKACWYTVTRSIVPTCGNDTYVLVRQSAQYTASDATDSLVAAASCLSEVSFLSSQEQISRAVLTLILEAGE